MSQESKIIWLASYPKSGNTWLRVFLYQYFYNNSRSDINKLYEFIPGISDKHLYIDANAGVEPSETDYAHLRPKVIRKIVSNNKKGGLIFLKSHNARAMHCKQETVPTELTAKAIYIVRNPLDIVDSLACYTSLSIDDAVELMCETRACIGGVGTSGGMEILTTWSEHVMSWAYGDQHYPTLIVRYEDLLTTPGLFFRNVVSFLGWQVYEDQLQKSVENSSFEHLQAFEDKHGFIENPEPVNQRFFRTGRSKKWQDILSDAQVNRIIESNSLMMKRLGYLDQNLTPV